MSLECLWVGLRLKHGELSLVVDEPEGTGRHTLSAESTQLILSHWCSPSWVFKSQKQNLVFRRRLARELQRVKTLYLEHRSRRSAPRSPKAHDPAVFDQEGAIVDAMYTVLLEQQDAMQQLSDEVSALKEKIVTVGAAAEAVRQRQAPSGRASPAPAHQNPPPVPNGGGAEATRPQHEDCARIDAKLDLIESLLRSWAASAEQGVPTAVPGGAAMAVPALAAARKLLRRVDAILRQREADVGQLRRRLDDKEQELARHVPRCPRGDGAADQFQERLRAVRRQAELSRAAAVHEELAARARSQGVAQDALLDRLAEGEGAALELALSQLERCADGSVARHEWMAWVEALRAIGQCPERILDTMERRMRELAPCGGQPELALPRLVAPRPAPLPQRAGEGAVRQAAARAAAQPYRELVGQLRQAFDQAATGGTGPSRGSSPASRRSSPAGSRASSPCSSRRSSLSGGGKGRHAKLCPRRALAEALRAEPHASALRRSLVAPAPLPTASVMRLREAHAAAAAAAGRAAPPSRALRERLPGGVAQPAELDGRKLLRGVPAMRDIEWRELERRAAAVAAAEGPAGSFLAPDDWGAALLARLDEADRPDPLPWSEFSAMLRAATAPPLTSSAAAAAAPGHALSAWFRSGSVSPPTDDDSLC